MAKKNSKVEHKCWYCMTDWEKNDWLKAEGFKVRYPINFHMPSMMSQNEVDGYLDKVHNANFILFV